LALAELAFIGGQWELAEDYRRVANPGADTPELSDQSASLSLFLADAQKPAKDEEVIAMALQFLRDRPSSKRAPEVRMKLGEVYFRRENFADAETQFDTVAKIPSESRYAETALFLAGQSAMRTINPGSVTRALKYFEQVVDRNGPLKLYARQQQALIQGRTGKEDEAVKIYENILAAQPPPDSELRYAALCGKGDNLLVLAQKDEKARAEAVASFEKLATEPEAPASWRNQALFKKAQALELAADREGALRAYYDVLQLTLQGDEREYFWFTKAGFEAARMLESQAHWKAAVGVYEKIAAAQGPRAQEALERVKQLRLEHFLWD
jgi:tetratricopeptide (TPR) repeat protein